MNKERTHILRPIKLGIIFSLFGEIMLFALFGLILYPEGDWFIKFFWTIIFCGLGMGAALGAFVLLLIAGRFDGWKAIFLNAILSILLLGLGSNLLCLNLDTVFHFFGGGMSRGLFLANGILLATVGGWLMGWLQWTQKGKEILRIFKL